MKYLSYRSLYNLLIWVPIWSIFSKFGQILITYILWFSPMGTGRRYFGPCFLSCIRENAWNLWNVWKRSKTFWLNTHFCLNTYFFCLKHQCQDILNFETCEFPMSRYEALGLLVLFFIFSWVTYSGVVYERTLSPIISHARVMKCAILKTYDLNWNCASNNYN